MIRDFKIKQLGYDFMGYEPQVGDMIHFHHLLVPRRMCKEYGLGEGYVRWNGVLLFSTPHAYLHLIEAKDLDIYLAITSEMLDMNFKGYLDTKNLRYIDDCLCEFEKEHINDKNKHGKHLIKSEYLQRNIFML
jgi:hypothetical protein